MTDAKRNDIGATAECYAKAYLGETAVGENSCEAFASDFLTVNGYLGSDGIKPFLGWMQKRDKGIFVLVKTSNKSSGELQDLKLENGETVYEYMGALVEKWGADYIGKYGYSSVGGRGRCDASRTGGSVAPPYAAYFFPDPRLRCAGRDRKRSESLFRSKGVGRYRQFFAWDFVRIQAGKVRWACLRRGRASCLHR